MVHSVKTTFPIFDRKNDEFGQPSDGANLIVHNVSKYVIQPN